MHHCQLARSTLKRRLRESGIGPAPNTRPEGENGTVNRPNRTCQLPCIPMQTKCDADFPFSDSKTTCALEPPEVADRHQNLPQGALHLETLEIVNPAPTAGTLPVPPLRLLTNAPPP